MKRRILAIVLSLCMILTLTPCVAMADENPVAKIGDAGYASLQEAVNNAGEGAEIVLQSNASGDGVIIPEGKNLTINLNTFTYTVGGTLVGSSGTPRNGFQILKDSNVVIKNGTIDAENQKWGADKDGAPTVLIQNYADLTLTDVVLDNTRVGDDGDGDSYPYALSVNSGTVLLNGNTSIKAPAHGTAFDSNEKASYEIPTVTVDTTGTIDGNIEVTGGNLVVKKGAFTDLADAVTYAAENAVISLAKNVSGDGVIIPEGKNLTIDLNTFTYTVDGTLVGSSGTPRNGFQILKDSNVVIKNGTIDAENQKWGADKDGAPTVLIQNYADLTLTDVILDNTRVGDDGDGDSYPYALSINSGTVLLSGNTSISAPEYGTAFDVYKNASYAAPTVTIEISGTIDGNFEVSEEATLIVKGGTFNTSTPALYVADGYRVTGEGPWTVETIPAPTPTPTPTPSTPPTTTETTTNQDGSTTTTVTDNKTGTVTETTKNTDGTTTTVETKKDGTVTETKENTDGSTSSVETKADGTVTATNTEANGVRGTTVKDSTGTVTEVKAEVPEAAVTEAAEKNEVVTLPIEEVVVPEAPKTEGTAETPAPAASPAIQVSAPAETTVKVEVPVADSNPNLVAVLVNEDGTETILTNSYNTENGIVVPVEGNATIKIVNNEQNFNDTENHWGEDSVDFVAARGIFNGTGNDGFTPDGTMTRGMLMTVLARMSGVDTTGGDTWYQKGLEWAVANGISDGTNPDAEITREQLATMLYRYMGSPDTNGSLGSFTDGHEVSDWALTAKQWAVENGLMGGMGDGTIAPQADATRAQVAAMIERMIKNL